MGNLNCARQMVAGLLFSGTLLFAGNASAYFIDFEQQTTGGTLTCSGGECMGTDIPMLKLKADTDRDGVGDFEADVETLLNFDTATGIITIIGDALSLDDETLLSGTIADWSVTSFGTSSLAFAAQGPDSKNLELLEELGIPTDVSWEFFTFNLTSSAGEVISADIANVQVPAPGVLGLLGIGLAGLAFAGRRFGRRVF